LNYLDNGWLSFCIYFFTLLIFFSCFAILLLQLKQRIDKIIN
jgi:hypothetical protein